eukprot:2928761-Pleurochrysis_carterae.AAC.1
MPSRAPSFHFACTLAVFVPASNVYLARARPLCSEFPVFRAHSRRRRPLRPRPEIALRRVQPPAPRLSTFQPDRTVVPSVKVPKLTTLQNTPGSGVRGSKESVLTTDSDRARPLSGGFVNHLVELPGLGKSGRPV